MSKIDGAIHEIHRIDEQAKRNQWVNQIHPLVKLLLTVGYLVSVVSLNKYDITRLCGSAVYLVLGFELSETDFRNCLKRFKLVLPFLVVMAAANPFFDRQIQNVWFGISVTGGVISMITLILKGIFALSSGYLLIATTSIEDICCALRLLHLPKLFVTVVLLIYRYLSVLLEEVERITQAYLLRAPGQKGISYRAWGPLVGQLLLRSIDRAEAVYESMCLRGYHGEFQSAENVKFCGRDMIFLLAGTGIILLFRMIPVFEAVGKLFL